MRWFIWTVVLPIFGPIASSILFALLWWSLNPEFRIDPKIIFDVSPWALTFFSMTLIGSTLNEFWPKLSQHKILGGALVITALAVTVYAAIMVIRRHYPGVIPQGPAYFVTGLLWFVSVLLCYQGYSASKG